ncbi:MAG TPA: NAD(P)H-dependent oxidoreductase [Chitinophagaceae bacterium]|jgi:NAD(P)H-dependent FMN reductase|nr:NAD(P)H-dependent oxidoreductase [Chitinophagaceae bacterium]
MRIEIISGSPRHNSVTHRLALHLQQQIQLRSGHDVGVIDLRDGGLPPLQSVFLSPDSVPDEHRALAERMFGAEAFILVTPEYNGSYTPDLKNLLDHFPKQTRKPFGIVTGSPGALGGIRAALSLQALVYALFGIGSPHMLVTPQIEKKFDAEGNLTDESFAKSVDVFIKEYLWLAEKLVEEKVSA